MRIGGRRSPVVSPSVPGEHDNISLRPPDFVTPYVSITRILHEQRQGLAQYAAAAVAEVLLRGTTDLLECGLLFGIATDSTGGDPSTICC